MCISSYGTREDCNGVCFCLCLLKCAASTSHTPLPFLTGILAAYLAWPTWIFIYSFHMNAVFFIDLFYKCWWQKVFVWTVFSFFLKLLFSCFKKKKKSCCFRWKCMLKQWPNSEDDNHGFKCFSASRLHSQKNGPRRLEDKGLQLLLPDIIA